MSEDNKSLFIIKLAYFRFSSINITQKRILFPGYVKDKLKKIIWLRFVLFLGG